MTVVTVETLVTMDKQPLLSPHFLALLASLISYLHCFYRNVNFVIYMHLGEAVTYYIETQHLLIIDLEFLSHAHILHKYF